MALYIPHSIFHLARLLYVRPETFGPYYVLLTHQSKQLTRKLIITNIAYGLWYNWNSEYEDGIIDGGRTMRETIQNVKGLSCSVTKETGIKCLWFSSSKTAEMLTSRWYSISINLQNSSSLVVGGSGGTVNGTPSHVSDSPHATFPLYTWLITTSST